MQDVWLKYLHYLESNMKAVPVVVLPVLDRAVRNCPWQASLWASYIRALERYKKPQAEIDAVRVTALFSVGCFVTCAKVITFWLIVFSFYLMVIPMTDEWRSTGV